MLVSPLILTLCRHSTIQCKTSPKSLPFPLVFYLEEQLRFLNLATFRNTPMELLKPPLRFNQTQPPQKTKLLSSGTIFIPHHTTWPPFFLVRLWIRFSVPLPKRKFLHAVTNCQMTTCLLPEICILCSISKRPWPHWTLTNSMSTYLRWGCTEI